MCIRDRLYGVSIFDTILPVLGYTSPIGAGIYLIYLLASNEYTYSDFIGCISAGAYGKWVVFFLLFTAAVFALSMFLYLKRKAEDVSKPYVYKLLYYLVITSVLMAISLIARYDITTIIPVIIFSSLINEQMRAKGELLGANAQLSKPEIGQLVGEIDKLINAQK